MKSHQLGAFQQEFGAYRGLARVLKSPSNAQNCTKKEKNPGKGHFYFLRQTLVCTNPWWKSQLKSHQFKLLRLEFQSLAGWMSKSPAIWTSEIAGLSVVSSKVQTSSSNKVSWSAILYLYLYLYLYIYICVPRRLCSSRLSCAQKHRRTLPSISSDQFCRGSCRACLAFIQMIETTLLPYHGPTHCNGDLKSNPPILSQSVNRETVHSLSI